LKCLLYVLTSQKKKTHKKNKVQCLDVYELFNDCVEHDHFYTRRFLIKDHGFALSVCCLLVTVRSRRQEVTWFWLMGKILGGQGLQGQVGAWCPSSPGHPAAAGVRVRGWDRERRAQRCPGTMRWGTRCSLCCPRAQGWGRIWGRTGRFLLVRSSPRCGLRLEGCSKEERDIPGFFFPLSSEAGPASPSPSGPTWAN